MNNLPLDPHLIPLLNGVKPYLGAKSRNLADMFTGVVDLLTSNSGKEVISTMSQLLVPKTVSAVHRNPVQSIAPQMFVPAFSLFLILILLIFATGAMGWTGLTAEEISDVNTCDQPEGDHETQI